MTVKQSRVPAFRSVCLLLWAVVAMLFGTSASARTQAVSPEAQRILQRAHQYLNDGHDASAIEYFEQARRRVRDRYARAVVLYNLGYAQLRLKRLADAARSLGLATTMNVLPQGAQNRMRGTLGEVLVKLDRPREATAMLEAYLANTSAPTLQTRLLLADLYMQAERYRDVTGLLDGIAREVPDARQKERVLQVLVEAYRQRGIEAQTVEPLKALLRHYPGNREYWIGLARVYFKLQREPDAMQVLEDARLRGYLTRPVDIDILSRLYVRQQQPAKAAKLLETTLDSGQLPPSRINLNFAAEAWRLAGEPEQETVALQRALASTPDAVLSLRLAELHIAAQEWRQAVEVSSRASRHDAGPRRGKLLMQQGYASYRAAEYPAAADTFAAARAFPLQAGLAQEWVDYLGSVQRGEAPVAPVAPAAPVTAGQESQASTRGSD